MLNAKVSYKVSLSTDKLQRAWQVYAQRISLNPPSYPGAANSGVPSR